MKNHDLMIHPSSGKRVKNQKSGFLNNQYKMINKYTPKRTSNGFNLEGYLIRILSWKSIFKSQALFRVSKILPITIKQHLDTSKADQYLYRM